MSDLRDQLAEAIYNGRASGPVIAWERVLADPDFAGYRADAYQRADYVMDLIQPKLDAGGAERDRLRAIIFRARGHLDFLNGHIILLEARDAVVGATFRDTFNRLRAALNLPAKENE